MTKKFIMYIPGSHLSDFHKRSPWIMLPVSFNKLGYSVVLICGKYTLSDVFGIEVYETYPRNKKLLRSLTEPFFAFRKIFETDADIVMVSPVGLYLFSILPLIAIYKIRNEILCMKKSKFILKMDWSLDFYGQGKISRILSTLFLVASSLIFDRVTSETYCGVARTKELPMINSSKVIRVPIGFPQNTDPYAQSDRNRKDIILCVARISPMKGQEFLLKAFAMVAYKYPSWSVRLIGPVDDAVYKEKLDSIVACEKLEARVSFLGFIGEKELYNEFSNASIFCLPSIYLESAGNVKYEATAVGLPVVTTDVPCRQDAEDMGWVVARAADAKDLAKKMEVLISHPTMRKSIVENSKNLLLSYEDVARMYIEL